MTNLKEKKCIIFDLGNVVIDIDLNITYKRFEELGFNGNKNLISKYKQNGIFEDIEKGRISAKEFIAEIKKKFNPKVTNQEIIDAWNALMLDYKEERIRTILMLKKKYKVYLLSNTNVFHVETCANKVPIVGTLTNLFDKVFYSHELGMSKPSEDIFRTVLNDIHFKPKEILFLDDSLANIKAAERLGIESWLIEYPNQWIPKFDSVLSEISGK